MTKNPALIALPCVLLTCALCPSTSSAAKILEYRFDDPSETRAVDTSGRGLHGVFMGSSTHIAPGGHGNAVALNGVDDFIDVGDADVLDITGKYTLMGWINYRDTGEGAAELMEKGGAYWLNVRGADQHARAGGFFHVCDQPGERWYFLDSPQPIPENTWTHLASTYNGSKLKIFVNGKRVATRSVPGPVCENDNPLSVGAKYVPANNENTNFVDGMLDDVRVYDTALSASRIRSLMGSAPGSGGGSQGVLRFGDAAVSAGEGAGSAAVTVERAGGADGDVSVAYSTGGGSATEGADYAFTQGTLNWADGDAAARTASVPLIDDGDFEGDETVSLALGNPGGGAVLGDPDTVVLTITDNDESAGQVMCEGTVATIVGTSGGETLLGTPGPDVIQAFGGSDVVRGRGGDDIICGGWGADDLRGNGGSDQLFGEGGRDRLIGGAGEDLCDGGTNGHDSASTCEQTAAIP